MAIQIPDFFEKQTKARTAYFAGLIDGEGYITLAKNQQRASGPVWNVPSIVVGMTCRETILALASYFGCGSVAATDRKLRAHHKTLYVWTIRWNDARKVAALIRPYCITRREALDRIINLPPQRSGPRRRFDAKKVREIRRNYPKAGSYKALGEKYGIGAMTAWKIVKGEMYGDVT